MSTIEAPAKRPTLAEVEALLASEPVTAAESCSDLQADIDNDYDILNNLQDFPGNRRAAVRAAIMKDIKATLAAMKAQGCNGR